MLFSSLIVKRKHYFLRFFNNLVTKYLISLTFLASFVQPINR